MRVQLDRERCQGHGRCYVLAPSVYQPDDDGYGTLDHGAGELVSSDVAPENHGAATLGAGNCPEEAIEVLEP